jgi:putative flippase GtrA
MAAGLRTVYILLGVFAVFFSLLAAVQIGSIQDEHAKIFAFIAAISIAFMTAFNLTDKSNNVRDAWRELNAAVMKYNTNRISKSELIEVYRKQEEKIGGVFFSKSF